MIAFKHNNNGFVYFCYRFVRCCGKLFVFRPCFYKHYNLKGGNNNNKRNLYCFPAVDKSKKDAGDPHKSVVEVNNDQRTVS